MSIELQQVQHCVGGLGKAWQTTWHWQNIPQISSITKGKDSAKAATCRNNSRLTCGGVQGSCQQAEAKEDAQQIHGARTGRGAGQGMDVRPLELQAHQMPRKPWRMELGQQLSEMCNAGAFRRVVKERQWNSRLLEAPYQLRFCCGSIRECCPAARGCSMQVS